MCPVLLFNEIVGNHSLTVQPPSLFSVLKSTALAKLWPLFIEVPELILPMKTPDPTGRSDVEDMQMVGTDNKRTTSLGSPQKLTKQFLKQPPRKRTYLSILVPNDREKQGSSCQIHL